MFPAFEQILFMISCEHNAYMLRDCLNDLDVPAGRTFALDASDLGWLRRNLFVLNKDADLFDKTMQQIRVCYMFAASAPHFEQIIGMTR